MSFFSTTHDTGHRSLLPAGLTRDAAIQAFRDPDFLVKLDNDYASHEADTAAWPDVDKQPRDKTVKIKVTSNVAVLPKVISNGSAISYRVGLTEVENGVIWLVSSSLGMDQSTTWLIEPATKADLKGDAGPTENRYTLVETGRVKASRILMGTIKGRLESDWYPTHQKIIKEAQRIQDSKAPAA